MSCNVTKHLFRAFKYLPIELFAQLFNTTSVTLGNQKMC